MKTLAILALALGLMGFATAAFAECAGHAKTAQTPAPAPVTTRGA